MEWCGFLGKYFTWWCGGGGTLYLGSSTVSVCCNVIFGMFDSRVKFLRRYF